LRQHHHQHNTTMRIFRRNNTPATTTTRAAVAWVGIAFCLLGPTHGSFHYSRAPASVSTKSSSLAVLSRTKMLVPPPRAMMRSSSSSIASSTTRTTTTTQRHMVEPQDMTRLTSSAKKSSPDEGKSSALSSFASPLNQPILAALDVGALVVFAAVGKASHASDGSLDLWAVFQTALPFVLAWFSTSFLTGVYSNLDSSSSSSSSTVENNEWLFDSWKQTAVGWIIAMPLGCVGRGIIKGYPPPAPFVIVTMIATLILLGGTRTLYYYFLRQSWTKPK
jgi:hypothetical protein